MAYTIKYPRGKVLEIPSAKAARKLSLGDGMVAVTCDLKAADGTLFNAICEFDTLSSGEHCGMGILLPTCIVWQRDEGFLAAIGKTKEEFFPYKYKRRKEINCEDLHVGEDGWSR
jgi:hypothetical protein